MKTSKYFTEKIKSHIENNAEFTKDDEKFVEESIEHVVNERNGYEEIFGFIFDYLYMVAKNTQLISGKPNQRLFQLIGFTFNVTDLLRDNMTEEKCAFIRNYWLQSPSYISNIKMKDLTLEKIVDGFKYGFHN